MKKIYIFTMLLLLILPTAAQAQIVLNEVLASNSGGLQDEDGDTSDWIEIYNPSDAPVALKDYSLSDNGSELSKWIFPDMNINPGEFLIVFASGKDRSQPGAPLHTNFKISAEGESVLIYSLVTKKIVHIIYAQMPTNVSVGLKPDGMNPDNFLYFDQPTPGMPNTTTGYAQLAPSPEFSHARHFQPEAFYLTLMAEAGTIYYSLDGSEPQPITAYLYQQPIPIDKTTVVRARTFGANMLPSPIITKTFFIDRDPHGLAVLSIAANPDDLFSAESGIFYEGNMFVEFSGQWSFDGNIWQHWERKVNAEFLEPSGTDGFNLPLGMKVHGYSSRHFPQKSFTLFARGQYGAGSIEYPVFPQYPELDQFEALLVRNGGNDNGETTFRDALAQTIVADETDIDFQRARPVIVYINGEYWGKYNLREQLNEHYIASHHPDLVPDPDDIDFIEFPRCEEWTGEWDQISCSANVIKGDLEAFDRLTAALANYDTRTTEFYEYMKTQIDMNNFIDYFITEIFFANGDWPMNNVKMWRPRTPEGKWRWILWDIDLAFNRGGGSISWGSWANNTLASAFSRDIFYKKLFYNPLFFNDFSARMKELFTSTLSKERILEFINRFKDEIMGEMPLHIARWKDTPYPCGYCPTDESIQLCHEDCQTRPQEICNEYCARSENAWDDFCFDYCTLNCSFVACPDENQPESCLTNCQEFFTKLGSMNEWNDHINSLYGFALRRPSVLGMMTENTYLAKDAPYMPAQITSPTPGEILHPQTMTFSWNLYDPNCWEWDCWDWGQVTTDNITLKIGSQKGTADLMETQWIERTAGDIELPLQDFPDDIETIYLTLITTFSNSEPVYQYYEYTIGQAFIRGDSNMDGSLDIADPIHILLYLFSSGRSLSIPDAADANDDGQIDIADPISLLRFLFANGESPKFPFPNPGIDLTPDGL